MDEVTLFNLLKSTGLPVAYHHFKTPPDPPYVVYLVADAEVWGSDHRNELNRTSYLVELYTTRKDIAAQSLIESLFDELGFEYSFNEVYIESESLYQVAYSIELTTKIRRA